MTLNNDEVTVLENLIKTLSSKNKLTFLNVTKKSQIFYAHARVKSPNTGEVNLEMAQVIGDSVDSADRLVALPREFYERDTFVSQIDDVTDMTVKLFRNSYPNLAKKLDDEQLKREMIIERYRFLESSGFYFDKGVSYPMVIYLGGLCFMKYNRKEIILIAKDLAAGKIIPSKSPTDWKNYDDNIGVRISKYFLTY